MRISVFLGVSVDGFIAHADGSLDFLTSFTSPGEDHGYDELMRTVDAIVVGRETYDTVATFEPWPWQGKRVVVLTHRPITAMHGETTHAGALTPLVAQLAAQGVQRIYLDGGRAVRCGLDEDLVDDLTLSIVPRMIGAGRPLFGTGAAKVSAWTLASTRTYASGLVQLRYLNPR